MTAKTAPIRRHYAEVNMQDVANLAGVSKTTVSRVMRNERNISDQTREKVQEAIKRLNYKSNVLARSIFSRRTYNLGVVLPDIAFSFFSHVLLGIEAAAYDAGYTVTLINTMGNAAKESEGFHRLIERRVDGMILVPTQDDVTNNTFVELLKNGVPFVVIDRQLTGLPISYVMADDTGGACQAIEHLVGLGHRRIAHLAGPQKFSTAKFRFEGYQDALRQAGLQYDPNYVVPTRYEDSVESLTESARRLLSQPNRPSAVFAVTDKVAIGAYRAARELGLKIPDDLSVVGFANLEVAETLSVPLTTVDQPKEELGRSAVELLIATVEHEIEGPRNVVLPTQLIVRSSTAPPRD